MISAYEPTPVELRILQQYGRSLHQEQSKEQNQSLGSEAKLSAQQRAAYLALFSEYASSLRKSYLQQKRARELQQRQQLYLGQGIYFDLTAHIYWTRCSAGQSWDGLGCSGQSMPMTWQQALDFAAESNFAGLDDWRLPSAEELQSLVDCGGADGGYQDNLYYGGCVAGYQSPTINPGHFPDADNGRYWSGSPGASDVRLQRVVDFGDGNSYDVDHAYAYYLRLVRD